MTISLPGSAVVKSEGYTTFFLAEILMRLIAAIVAIALLGATVCSQDYSNYMTANTNIDRPQSDSSTYLPTFNTQQPLEKFQIFEMATNFQQNDVTNYRVQRLSAFYIPPKIGSSAYGQSSSTSYSTPSQINSQQYLSRIRRQLGRHTGGNEGIEVYFQENDLISQIFSSEVRTKKPPQETTTLTTVPFLLDIDGSTVEYDLDHPPHIHNVDVECSKTMMTINIEFNRAFNGIIYSKGYFMNPECTYVKQNSGLTRYSFTLNLDSCGTQFINDFEDTAGQAYLENVLVLQIEPNIQEVWDAVRRVRCLWEGNINKVLTANLSVDVLNQEIVTFSGDTATAKLDIQIGKGPFAPAADGLVRIGETMTLVVSVKGDPDFDLQVRDCLARDEASTNILHLTDERGCILKPKLFGAFQKTSDTGNTGASVIAYAFFQAFKFPDIMDLFIECNVELCKTNCEPCPEANQQIEPGRHRRSVTHASSSNNSTNNTILLSDPVRVRQRFKVIMLDELSVASNQILRNMKETAVEATTAICISNNRFVAIFSLMLCTHFVAIISAVVLYVKLQRIHRLKLVDL